MNLKQFLVPSEDILITQQIEGTGDHLVFLHAFPFNHEMWRPQIDTLKRSYMVCTPNVFGFGGSNIPRQGWTIESMADTVAMIIRGIFDKGPVVLCGLSMGGYIALAFARKYPEMLRGLILSNTKAEADTDEAKANRDRAIEFLKTHIVEKYINEMLPKLVGETTKKDHPEIVAEVRRIALQQNAAGIIAALQALRDRPDATPTLSKIAVPTLVIVGEEDILIPPQVTREMSAQIPHSTFCEIPQAGHLSNLEAPQEFNHAVSTFLHTLKSR